MINARWRLTVIEVFRHQTYCQLKDLSDPSIQTLFPTIYMSFDMFQHEALTARNRHRRAAAMGEITLDFMDQSLGGRHDVRKHLESKN